jgi:hypothetical protein
MPTRSHVGWGLAISLLLHSTGIAALSLALPRLNVRPGVVVHSVEFAVLDDAERVTEQAAATAAEQVPPQADPAASIEVSAAAVQTTAPRPVQASRKSPLVAATPALVPSATRADPRSDGSVLQRVLRQIASTNELTQDERRKAMLVVLRTWEDPSGKRSADELINALLENARQARTGSQPAAPAEPGR